MLLRNGARILAIVLAAGGATWTACGDDDDPAGAVFFGDVSSVSGSIAAVRAPSQSQLAWLSGPRDAWAQSTCATASGGNLLFCVDDVCTRVRSSTCEFSESVHIEGGGPVAAVLHFVDDFNEDGDQDADEGNSTITQNLRFCSGDQVLVDNAAINFTTAVTTAMLSKTVDNCPGGGGGTTPTRTSTGTAGTPSPTGTAGTPTPTGTYGYGYGASLQKAPALSFVFLASIGVIGLLIPRRRRR